MELKDLIKQASELQVPEGEKVAALAALSMEAGFTSVIMEEAQKRGFQAEKTAAVSKKIAGREVTFSKMSIEDLTSHLTSQFSVPAKHDVEEKSADEHSDRFQAMIERMKKENPDAKGPDKKMLMKYLAEEEAKDKKAVDSRPT